MTVRRFLDIKNKDLLANTIDCFNPLELVQLAEGAICEQKQKVVN